MIIFLSGIAITDVEHKSLLYMVADPEAWLLDAITEKARLRKAALLKEWQPKLFADPSITELPADGNELCELIMARDDYKSRSQVNAEQDPPVVPLNYNLAKFEGTSRVGKNYTKPERVPSDATVTLFADGINLTDIDVSCILAYVSNLENWVIGALMGQVHRGKQLIIRDWQPIILADPEIVTMPATEDGLINMIVSREDYQTRNN